MKQLCLFEVDLKPIEDVREKKLHSLSASNGVDLAMSREQIFLKIQKLLDRPLDKSILDTRRKISIGPGFIEEEIYRYLKEGELNAYELDQMLNLVGAELYLYFAEIIASQIKQLKLQEQLSEIDQILDANLVPEQNNFEGVNARKNLIRERKMESYNLAKNNELDKVFMIERVFSVGKKMFEKISEQDLIKLFSDAGLVGYVMGDLKLFEINQLEIVQLLINNNAASDVGFFINDFEQGKLSEIIDLICQRGLARELLESVDGLLARIDQETFLKWFNALKPGQEREDLIKSVEANIFDGTIPGDKYNIPL